MRLFNSGRRNALIDNNTIIQYLTRNDFLPLKVEQYFVVYDSNINLDKRCKRITSDLPQSKSEIVRIGHEYRIGDIRRKVPKRSTE
ncbi:unnamed protein product [Rotaria sp. Silwood2]|nr:unnamed protein product [Rotaria sp. Silwood2]CAF4728110.1 unnamed protein product [Rotaria sp. Silwood2]